MEIILDREKYYFETVTNNKQRSQWLLLHGFMGSHHDFDTVIPYLNGMILLPDLLGHGKSRTSAPYTRYYIDRQIDDLAALIKQRMNPPINLWGYSMGGRLALGLTLKHPELVKRLVLESSTAGITSSVERLNRRQHDQQLVKALKQGNLFEFVSAWENLKLFASQKRLPLTQQKFIHQQRMGQDSICLANSLLGMGTGTMPNYWPQLHELDLPVTLLAGALDSKYIKLTAQMEEILPFGQRHIIRTAGHNTHLEQPFMTARIIKQEEHYK